MNYSNKFLLQLSKVCQDDNYDWVMLDENYSDEIRLLFEGPKNSPYEGGLFRVKLDFEDYFPNKPPVVKFITRLWHPLVEFSSGKMCQDYFKENWSTDCDVKKFLELLKNMLTNYNHSSGINLDAINDISEGTFENKVKSLTEKYASP